MRQGADRVSDSLIMTLHSNVFLPVTSIPGVKMVPTEQLQTGKKVLRSQPVINSTSSDSSSNSDTFNISKNRYIVPHTNRHAAMQFTVPTSIANQTKTTPVQQTVPMIYPSQPKTIETHPVIEISPQSRNLPRRSRKN